MSVLNQSLDPAKADLIDLFNAWKKDVLLSLNCHHIGTIQSFNATNQTAKATINYPKIFFQQNIQGSNVAQPVPYPPVVDCPVICLGGGNANLTFPIIEGDECLILFNDRNLDSWLAQGAGQPPNNLRLHSFADAIILVGLRSKFKQLSNYSTTHATLNASTGTVGINNSTGKILIQNNSETLDGVLQALIGALVTFATGLSVGTLPTQAASLVTNLGGSASTPTPSVSTQITELLE